jgi:hypothetical protein
VKARTALLHFRGQEVESLEVLVLEVAHTLVMLATQEAEIRRIKVRSQPGQIVQETLSWKNPSQKKMAGGEAQGVGPEFKPYYHKKKKKKKKKERKEKKKNFMKISHGD